MNAPYNRNVGWAVGALLASSTTLVCCVLPAVLVSLGAGAAVAGLVAAVPQLIWLSEHKIAVFGTTAALLVASGAMLWQARQLPCPTDARVARSCARMRSFSHALYAAALLCFVVGVLFAFVLPALPAG
jgi:hypothetical protein